SFRDLLEANPDAVAIGVDIPIGLTSGPLRACDFLARRAIGRRGASVFPAPIRPVLSCADYRSALTACRVAIGKGMSVQAFNIVAKVREVDELMTPDLRARVHEVAPELSFKIAAGRDLVHAKRTPEGFEERRAILRSVLPV